MSISAISSSTASYQTNQASSMNVMKKNFENLGNALSSGSIDDAKTAFAQIQKNAPASNGKTNPMSEDMDALGKALESGDLKSAQSAYSKIQDKISQGPPAGGPKGGGGGESQASASLVSNSSNQTYDKMDINEDGIVSYDEKAAYYLEHPEEADTSKTNQSSNNNNYSIGTNVDTMA